MTAVRRFNKDGDGGTPTGPATLLSLMGQLCDSSDFWDRPAGDFGPLDPLYGLTAEGRRRANSLYRLGSKALVRGEMALASDLLGEAADAGHPGALFRLALIALRQGDEWTQDAWFLVAEAARHGHGDAERLLCKPAGSGMSAAEALVGAVEDDIFLEEIRQYLGQFPIEHKRAGHAMAGEASDFRAPSRVPEGPDHLVLVPAPALPPLTDEPTDEDKAAAAPRLTALAGGLALPVPDLAERSARGHGLVLPGEDPWWSPNALRPAILTRLARASSVPSVVPERWQTTQRARDVVMLIQESGGIDTRNLTRRTNMPMHAVVRLMDWLRDQRFVESVEGVHVPGPLMTLITEPNQASLLTTALSELRDDLGAAVYISAYADGEIVIRESSFSDSAPAVLEKAPFGVTGHASAVGKSLLAQLTFPARMDHLTRYPSVQLTDRTITNQQTLFARLDDHGPHSAQFDLLEYSDSELCAAFSLGLPGRASSIALSLPLGERERLISAAEALSQRATGLLLAHLLAEDMQQQSAARTTRQDDHLQRALP
ncbi:IclR family transcriptional regulator C-terminal domain-containing protein [Streptomyces zhihengii]|uniref:IclR family transcriptional regulator domain-containing protein n=1 Tax=Streptomyces zhihengii TaxID=1818004 RepID=UPI0036366CD6